MVRLTVVSDLIEVDVCVETINGGMDDTCMLASVLHESKLSIPIF